jgi:hypothetical protein
MAATDRGWLIEQFTGDPFRGKKIVWGVDSIVGTGSIATGLSSIDEAFVSVKNSGSASPTLTASITGITGGSINVVVTSHGTAGNAVATGTANVSWLVIGRE